jgi:hypothetical protein
MEERSSTPLTDEYLKSLEEMQAADPGTYFYTRLKGRMQQQQKHRGYIYKPAWAILTLVFFLVVNIWMIILEKNSRQQNTNETAASVQAFAETYNLESKSNY